MLAETIFPITTLRRCACRNLSIQTSRGLMHILAVSILVITIPIKRALIRLSCRLGMGDRDRGGRKRE